jgi:hypothetical protein
MDGTADDWDGRDLDLSDDALCWALSRLVFLGARAMLALRRRGGPSIDLEEWRSLVLREAPELGASGRPLASPQLPLFEREDRAGSRRARVASQEQLLSWLWDVLTRGSPLVSEATPAAPIAVLPAGSRFRFELGGIVRSDVSAVVEGALLMKVGRRGLFTCLPVATSIAFEDGRPSVGVATLNEAYTYVSTLYEPERRSHTGNVYEKVLWVDEGQAGRGVTWEDVGGERLTRLKHIRDAVARGTWRSA